MSSRRLLSLTAMPATLAVAIGSASLALGWGAAVSGILPLVLLASILWVAWLERVLPYRPDWNRPRGDLLADALYLPTTAGVAALVRPAVATAGVVVAGWLSARFGLGLWPVHWPLLAQLLLSWVVVELFAYWPHRWLHEVPWLWRLHATHHSQGLPVLGHHQRVVLCLPHHPGHVVPHRADADHLHRRTSFVVRRPLYLTAQTRTTLCSTS